MIVKELIEKVDDSKYLRALWVVSYRFLLTGALGASWLFGGPEESVLKSSGDRQDSDWYRKR